LEEIVVDLLDSTGSDNEEEPLPELKRYLTSLYSSNLHRERPKKTEEEDTAEETQTPKEETPPLIAAQFSSHEASRDPDHKKVSSKEKKSLTGNKATNKGKLASKNSPDLCQELQALLRQQV
jgi:hypothetical protein